MVHKLHWERVRAGQRGIQWVSSDVIVERPEDVDELAGRKRLLEIGEAT